MNRNGIAVGVYLMRAFDDINISGFSWYTSPVYGLMPASYRNAPSLTVDYDKHSKFSLIKLN